MTQKIEEAQQLVDDLYQRKLKFLADQRRITKEINEIKSGLGEAYLNGNGDEDFTDIAARLQVLELKRLAVQAAVPLIEDQHRQAVQAVEAEKDKEITRAIKAQQQKNQKQGLPTWFSPHRTSDD